MSDFNLEAAYKLGRAVPMHEFQQLRGRFEKACGELTARETTIIDLQKRLAQAEQALKSYTTFHNGSSWVTTTVGDMPRYESEDAAIEGSKTIGHPFEALSSIDALEAKLKQAEQERDALKTQTKERCPDAFDERGELKWTGARTVGHLVCQLQTLDPSMKVGTVYHVDLPEGKKARATFMSLSRERWGESGWLDFKLNTPLSLAIWANPHRPLEEGVADEKHETEELRAQLEAARGEVAGLREFIQSVPTKKHSHVCGNHFAKPCTCGTNEWNKRRSALSKGEQLSAKEGE